MCVCVWVWCVCVSEVCVCVCEVCVCVCTYVTSVRTYIRDTLLRWCLNVRSCHQWHSANLAY